MKNFRIAGLSPALSLALTLTAAFVLALLAYHNLYAEGLMVATGAAVTLEDITVELKAQAQAFKTTSEELRVAQQELKERYSKDGALPENVKQAVDEMLSKFNSLKANVDDLEQKAATAFRHEQKAFKTYGEQFVDSEGFKAKNGTFGDRKGSVGLEIKQVNTTAVAGMIRSQRESGIVELPRERFVMRDLLTVIPTDSNAIDYVKQLTRTNSAAPVAEGVGAAYSDFAWENATVNVRRIAHLAKMSRQALNDAPRLMAEINSEMRYGLGYVEERQLLNGDNTGQNLHGVYTQATAFSQVAAGVPVQTNVTKLDTLRLAMLQAAIAGYPVDGIVLNQIDWALIELLKDSTGRYIIGNPAGEQAGKRLWGVRVVDTPAMTVDKFLVGNFAVGATLYDRQSTEIEISTENDLDFEKYLATMSAAERIALAVKRPGAFIKGDFSDAETDLEA